MRILTGIKPTGTPHLGNFVGAIRPALDMVNNHAGEAFLFIADAHAMTGNISRTQLLNDTYAVAATWLACGLDPEQVVFYRQSHASTVFEFSWALTCLTPKGLMNRAHAYKAARQENEEKGAADPDIGVMMGLYNYPILMAADIMLYSANLVPVGPDQLQHIEIARDLGIKFNQTYGETLVIPEATIQKNQAPLPGLDGRKMSKSYGNTIPLFADSNTLWKLIRKIKTNSQSPDEPKDPENCSLFKILSFFLNSSEQQSLKHRYQTGIGWGEVKEILRDTLEKSLGDKRNLYHELMADRARIDSFLEKGEARARAIGTSMMSRVHHAIGTAL
jgi:tryptophanyl-tRNA synthetase